MLPTLAEVLELDAVQAGAPRVLAAEAGLTGRVRWVHAIELADAARLLRGGELVLSTGIALPDEPARQARYVAELAGIGVTGLAVELGRKYARQLPDGLVAAARSWRLPLIAFEREVPFVEITEAVHARIIDSQLTELRAAARVHEVFTELAVAGAGPDEVVRAAAELAGRPVILADLTHAVLACAPASASATLVDGFAARSRQALAAASPVAPAETGKAAANSAAPGQPTMSPAAAGPAIAGLAGASVPGQRTAFDPVTGWLITSVGAHGEIWARVILACDRPPEPLDVVLIERAATTLALGRLQARQREGLERQAHRTLISAIVSQPDGTEHEEAAIRARALGLPIAGRQLIALVARLPASAPGLSAQAQVLVVTDAVADACRARHVPAIVGSLDDLRAGALLSFDARADPDPQLTAICHQIRQQASRRPRQHFAPEAAGELVLAAGSAADSIRAAQRSFAEARQVADAATDPDAGAADLVGRPFLRLADLRLDGLLQLLRGDPRVQGFAEREVGALLAYDAQHGSDLTSVLATYLDAGGNKAQTAKQTHLARPTLYERLAHIERLLGVSLDSPRSRTSLHVALLAQPAAPPGRP